MKLKTFLIYSFLVIVMPLQSRSQSVFDSQQFMPKIYGFPFRYEGEALKYFEEGQISPAYILTQGMIDSNGDGIYDPEMVKRFLKRFFPDKHSEGLCVLNWEGVGFRNLRDLSPGEPEFEKAVLEYINLLKAVKSYRPNLRISIYGLPFRFYYPSQQRFNRAKKLDSILKYCDFLAPSLYILYPDKQVGSKRNLKYLNDNLRCAFEYSVRLGKPVVPFVWHRIAPSHPVRYHQNTATYSQ